MSNIEISKSAEDYLLELLNKQDKETIGVKVFVSEPGTPHAETCIAYCKEEDDISGFDLVAGYLFPLYLEHKSLSFIEDANVDYSPDKFGGTLTIKAPNAKVPQVNENATLEERINYILYSEINPSLASHGGEVSLIEVIDDSDIKIQNIEIDLIELVTDNKDNKKRYRIDDLLSQQKSKIIDAICSELNIENTDGDDIYNDIAQTILNNGSKSDGLLEKAGVIDPHSGSVGKWTPAVQFNLMFKTDSGPSEKTGKNIYLRPETAQGIFINYLLHRTQQAGL